MKDLTPQEKEAQDLKRFGGNFKADYPNIYQQFKGACSANGLMMTTTIRTFMQLFIADPNKYLKACKETYQKEYVRKVSTLFRPKPKPKVKATVMTKSELVKEVAKDVMATLKGAKNAG